MRYFFIFSLLAFLSTGLLVNEASAARFGSMRHFGQRTKSLFSSPLKPKSSQYSSRTTSPRQHGFFRGLLMGGLLASLFMGHSMAGSLLSWMLLITVVLFMLNKFKRRS